MRSTTRTSPRSAPDEFPEIPETVFGVKKRLNFVFQAIHEIGPTSTILDVGCGAGELLSLPLAERGCNIVGIDRDTKSLEYARAAAESRRITNVRFEPQSAMHDIAPVDIIILSEVIEHVEQPEQFLRELHRLLAPKGFLILTLPNGHGAFEVDQWLWRHDLLYLPKLYYRLEHRAIALKERRGLSRSFATCNEHDPHVNFFTWKAINQLLSSTEFSVKSYAPRTLIAGSFSSVLVQLLKVAGLPCRRAVALNAWIPDRLPPQASAGWMFVCQRED